MLFRPTKEYNSFVVQCTNNSLVQWGLSLNGERDSNGV